ncbi:MAG: formylglycine-generating enzyme family protein [Dolichospermum sp.]
MLELEMIDIPEGIFIMGSSENEKGSINSERPQHKVTVKPFLMSQYPITQAQWRAVAELPQVNQKLQPNPSRFKGANRPVEQVSWYEAVEFCARLSRIENKIYRLPSEAQWEYACRAGTTTPFYCGKTISTDLVNYDGDYTYGDGSKGQYREQTTDVGFFPPNLFVLHDMHGNVWEWCQDDWHDNYEGAPIDGSAWISLTNRKVLRGGSWFSHADYCRSAYRTYSVADFNGSNIGFRVVCHA